MNPQLKGIETIPGTYPFDLRVSVRTLKINRFFWNLAKADARSHFLADAEDAFRRAELSEDESELIRQRNWIGLIRYGANFFVLEKFARVVRVSNLEVYAAMRGQSFEDFLKTRLVPDAR